MKLIQKPFVLSAAIATLIAVDFSTAPVFAKPNPAAPEVKLTDAGKQLEAKYAAMLTALKADIIHALPPVSEQRRTAIQKAREATNAAEKTAEETQKAFGAINAGKGLVEHAKGKWIGGAEKGIAETQAALKKAKTDAERDAANKELAKWQANKEEGLKALKERQADWDKAKLEQPRLTKANQAAQATLTKARTDEMSAVNTLLSEVNPVLGYEKLDAKMVKAVVLAHATPAGLAAFAQQGAQQQGLLEKLLGDDKLMMEMLVAGGASGGKYGQAVQIYAAILQANPKAASGSLQRLALATALENAVPIKQSNALSQTDAADTVDPVKRYQHYEKAFIAGELDPAFKDLNAWEYRMVVDCDAPDHILAWGREMLRAYRPDHITSGNYGWRYVASVKTDVTYGSQNVSKDLPALHSYQNIPLNGGVCGRRAFYGRFILRSFGIPVWGVTQKAHAALSHWTPNGWVINLGAGFEHSWWDKDDAPRSGQDFLLESQAREHGTDYLRVLRAQWVSRVLGEQPFNERKKVVGGFWSNVANYQSIVLASKAVALGPLGQELAEANEKKEKLEKLEQVAASESEKKASVTNGIITLPALSHEKPAGPFASMKSIPSGMQMHCKGGFKSEYKFNAPQAGKYTLTAKVATYQDGQKFEVTANDAKQAVDAAIPFTVGVWQETRPIEITLVQGNNTIGIALPQGSRGVSVKELTLRPAK